MSNRIHSNTACLGQEINKRIFSYLSSIINVEALRVSAGEIEMEQYSGVKFQYQQQACHFAKTKEIANLNSWACLFAELGLAPVHSTGAYGNFSCRAQGAFLISISGMIPEEKVIDPQYALIISCNPQEMTLKYCGTSPPSSETLMHHLIYEKRPDIKAILHGHNKLLLKNSEQLSIPETTRYYDYGSQELAKAAACIGEKEDCFLLKDHGFVSLGANTNDAGQKTLATLQRLIQLYQH